MHPKRGGYSFLIRPILVVFDLLVLALVIHYYLAQPETLLLYCFILVGWIVSSYALNFYEVYRFTKPTKIFSLLFKQGFVSLVTLYAYFGLVKTRTISIKETLYFVSMVMSIIGLVKIALYYSLKKYRAYLGGNKRKIIIIGNNESARELQGFFEKRKDLGYHILGVFGANLPQKVSDSFEFLKENDADEIYCALDEISDQQINAFVAYADKHYCVLKFIPNTKKILSQRLQTDYYAYQPVLSVPQVALNNTLNRILKRGFDIIFSTLILLLVVSWITPLLYILIKLESKGPIIYKHIRNGMNYREFTCYKFRSLKYAENQTKLHVKKSDDRITKIGKFIRRTSIDELPQFYNVIKGDMSVVGPRPHMVSYTEAYAKKIDKYNFMFRHAVKPGITGLAQVTGFRGEIKSDEDIINRIKYDIFYIENWSLFLDLKIIIETIFNIIKGDENAY